MAVPQFNTAPSGVTPPEPRVSVIVPVRNGAAFVGACVDSLLALDYPAHQLEIVVVDNASTDRTATLLRAYSSRIILLHEARRGAAAARNCGLGAASGDVVAFTDADCVVDRRWLRNLLPPLDDQHIGIVGGAVLARPACSVIEQYGETVHDQHLGINVYRPPAVDTANWCSRRELLTALGGFDASFRRGEDVDLSWRIVQAGYRLTHAPDAIVYHRNERRLLGLWREGIAHGFCSVAVDKRHAQFLQQFGYRRISWRSYRTIFIGLRQSFVGPGRDRATCEVAFETGRKVGKLLGSLRFLYLEL